MPIASAAHRTSGAGSTSLPISSLYAVANRTFKLREVMVANTTNTAVVLALRFLTGTGTQGSGLTELWRETGFASLSAPACQAFDTHSANPTITGGSICLFPLGAAIGSAVIRTFGDNGITVPQGTTNGVGIIPLTGTGQICDVDWAWEEV